MQFAGFGLLEITSVSEDIVFAQVEDTLILVLVGLRRHQSPSAAEIVLVGNLDTTVFALDHVDKGIGAKITTAHATRLAHVGQVYNERIVHGKVLVGIQEGRHLFEQMTRGTLRV